MSSPVKIRLDIFQKVIICQKKTWQKNGGAGSQATLSQLFVWVLSPQYGNRKRTEKGSNFQKGNYFTQSLFIQ